VKAFIVMTLEPIKYLKSSTAIKDSSVAELIYPESSIYYDWIDLYINRITNLRKISYLLLPEFTFQEIRVELAIVLKIGVPNLPRGVYICICIYVYVYTNMCSYLYASTSIYIYIYLCIFNKNTYIGMYKYLHN
jgi:hypothetical protein